MFYLFNQNNSGGYLYQNEDVDYDVIMEANSKNEAFNKLYELDSGINDWCECCGERWSSYCPDESEDFIKLVKITSNSIWEQTLTIVHFKDGSKRYWKVASNGDWVKRKTYHEEITYIKEEEE